ncbi:hypothetical protein JYU34_011548 [Plutella xylostella]|uniref:RNA-directed DNA polymerase n=1 Tax=Plutella xylostella TaxID=51655 RepID=A0ABQ7QKW9_PLUXY|nr:hypothetical protein JYU34_011548 [Plutella xylostella]
MPIGKIHGFDLEGGENWPAYVRLVKQFILLNDIKDNLRVATLVTHVGAPTYRLMCDLCAPDNPEDKPFDTLVELVKNHLEPKRSEIAERHVFRQRRQGQGENINVFLQSLKHLATHCNFENQLEVNLRDQFVSGLRSEEIRSRLFAETSLDYKKAVELALALEAAEQHAAKAAGQAPGAPWAAAGPTGLTADAGERVHRVSAARPAAAPGRDAAAPRRKACWRCGREGHAPHRCRYKSYVCDKCKVKGHLGSVCDKNDVSAGRSSSKYQNFMETDSSESGGEVYEGLYTIKGLSIQNVKDGPYYCELLVENQSVLFEIDTGSKISAVSKSFYDQHLSNLTIEKDNIKLQSYTGDAIVPLGRVSVRVSCSGAGDAILPLFIIEHGGPPLIGRTWMRELKLKSLNLFHLKEDVDPIVLELKQEFPEVFTDKIGTYKHKLSLHLSDNTPVFFKSRALPLALREPVENELKRLQDEGIIYKVDGSDYGTPIVPIIKPDGSIRLCGDYKVTVNKLLKDYHFPLPKIEELFATLSGGEQYSKLDFKNAFMQLELSESSQPLTAITTHVGTFVYRRAPFGLKCLPEKFQKIVFDTLNGLDFVVAFIDDICVSGRNKTHHLENLRAVLTRLREAGLTIKFSKCEFLKDEVCYLGYRINKHGLYTDTSKVNAITKMPIPENVSQLRALLGFINYYARFIPNLSTILHPLHALLKKGVKWEWSDSCNAAFEEIKVRLTSDPVLAHYSPELPLVLAVDSSAYGLGAVLAQRHPDGSERLVCCASRTLNDAERRYSQVDKEALAIVYGVTRHHQYLFGRHFTLRSDHKALSYIFGPKKGIPQTAASRLQRYAVRLAAYDFNIVFVKSEMNSNADGLSRLPLSKTKAEDRDDAANLHFVEDTFPLSHKDVAHATKSDKTLCKIYGYIMSGWPTVVGDSDDEKAYFHRRENLHIDHGCIVWGYRVVVPEKLRAQILEEVHAGHVGVVRMKSIARGYVWWPRLDADLEARAAACAACREQRDAPPRHAPVPYVWPSDPWTRLHVDFLQYQGKYYFLVLDSHSKWIEVFLMGTGTSANLVSNRLRECFSRFGLPKCLVSDGGPPFRSQEFEAFLSRNGIKHILIAPYHPSSNGAAENAVKTVKKVIKKAVSEGENIDRALNNFLLVYRNSTHTSTERSPAEALLGRRLRVRMDLLRPAAGDAVAAAQARQLQHAPSTTREVQIGDRVLFRDYSKNSPKWAEGDISERTGAVTYKVKSDHGEYRKHIDQIMPLRRHTLSSNPTITDNEVLNTDTWESAPNSPLSVAPQSPHASPPPAASAPPSDYADQESTSGDWVNNRRRYKNHINIDDSMTQES